MEFNLIKTQKYPTQAQARLNSNNNSSLISYPRPNVFVNSINKMYPYINKIFENHIILF